MTDTTAIIATHRHSLKHARAIQRALPLSVLFAPRALCAEPASPPMTPYDNLTELLTSLFRQSSAVVGLCATSLLVRVLAPLIAKTKEPPPLIAVSGDGRHVIPLLAVHSGGNRLARTIASALNTEAAVTTASDNVFQLALDDPPDGWQLASKKHYKSIVSRLLNGEAARLCNPPSWLHSDTLTVESQAPLTLKSSLRPPTEDANTLHYIPQRLALGIGCVRNVSSSAMLESVRKHLHTHNLAIEAVAVLASITVKHDEKALHDLSTHLGVPLRLFSAEQLLTTTPQLRNPSQQVFATVGCYGVAEGSALLAAGARSRLIVPKHVDGSITLALALARKPLIPRKGGNHIAIIGTGPGRPAMMTQEAQQQLLAAEHVVGYRLYLELAAPLLTGKTLHPFDIGQEQERARHALDLATHHHARVALLSSGDPALYAMAGLVFQCLDECAYKTPTRPPPSISVHPGVSAMHAASARAGAMLAHDCCAISLSDLLTPADIIEKRLEHAARGDFVIALYNPRARNRRTMLTKAHKLLLRHRAETTPIIIARHLYRDKEDITISTLKDMMRYAIDMYTIILIGSSQSRVRHIGTQPYVYTPRGYVLEDTS
ncbi:MAG: precorrin-3B C(17)-methyltransferase [Alphaproteobacteria bacterium GM202ARS2]|nr:precorrin-3B C(17)-methyltransferase [Alphaproteobacteria bacterium GM202ARS2]